MKYEKHCFFSSAGHLWLLSRNWIPPGVTPQSPGPIPVSPEDFFQEQDRKGEWLPEARGREELL